MALPLLFIVLALGSCAPAAAPGPLKLPLAVAPAATPEARATQPAAGEPPTRRRMLATCVDAVSRAEVAPVTSIREVDWCNQTFGLITLARGVGELHEYAELGGLHDTNVATLADVAYGDLDRDGAEDAVVLLHTDFYGTSGEVSESASLFVFVLRDGRPVRLDSEPAARAAEFTLTVEPARVTLRYVGRGEQCVERWHFRVDRLSHVAGGCVR